MQRIQTDFLFLYPLIPVKICLIRDVFVPGELLLFLLLRLVVAVHSLLGFDTPTNHRGYSTGGGTERLLRDLHLTVLVYLRSTRSSTKKFPPSWFFVLPSQINCAMREDVVIFSFSVAAISVPPPRISV